MIHTVWASRTSYSHRVLRYTSEMHVVKTFWFKRRALSWIENNSGLYQADGTNDWELFMR